MSNKETHIMIDLETFGVNPRAPIIQIGACKFDPRRGLIGRLFEVNVDWDNACRHGLVDGSTIRFWMKQPDDARRSIMRPFGEPLEAALEAFSKFCPSDFAAWGNGPSFDLAVLRHAYQRVGARPPWTHRDERDFRTIYHLTRAELPELERLGTHHSGLDDAVTQAVHVIRAYAVLGRGHGISAEEIQEIRDRLAARRQG